MHTNQPLITLKFSDEEVLKLNEPVVLSRLSAESSIPESAMVVSLPTLSSLTQPGKDITKKLLVKVKPWYKSQVEANKLLDKISNEMEDIKSAANEFFTRVAAGLINDQVEARLETRVLNSKLLDISSSLRDMQHISDADQPRKEGLEETLRALQERISKTLASYDYKH